MRERADRKLYSIVRGSPRLGPTARAETRGVRRVGELADVTAVEVSPADRRVQYQTFSHVEEARDDEHLTGLALVYDMTFLSARPIGWERSKTHGHVHVGSAGLGFAELYEVLEGRAGVLVQDLLPGPAASFAVLIEAEAGETVIIPPRLHHATVNLGFTTLVLGDVVARSADDDYALVERARGMAHYLGVDGSAHPNPTYREVPELQRVPAVEWSDAPRSPLYERLVSEPASLDWLSQTNRFRDRFPELWTRFVNR